MEPATSDEESDELDRLRRKIDSDIEIWRGTTSSEISSKWGVEKR